MTRTRIHNLSISLDGFGAGEGQSADAPMGHAGHRLHEWMIATRFGAPILGRTGGSAGVDDAFAQQGEPGFGAEIMGAGKFGPPGWQDDADWRGWWGPNPPFHTPTFVLTHRPGPPIEMEGGTTFYFVTSFEEAIGRALEAAGDDTVTIAGGASAVRQGFEAGVIDEIMLSHAPIVLGGGESPFAGLVNLRLKPIEVHASPNATHIVYSTRDLGDVS